METTHIMAAPAAHRLPVNVALSNRAFGIGWKYSHKSPLHAKPVANFGLDPFVYGPRAWGGAWR